MFGHGSFSKYSIVTWLRNIFGTLKSYFISFIILHFCKKYLNYFAIKFVFHFFSFSSSSIAGFGLSHILIVFPCNKNATSALNLKLCHMRKYSSFRFFSYLGKCFCTLVFSIRVELPWIILRLHFTNKRNRQSNFSL